MRGIDPVTAIHVAEVTYREIVLRGGAALDGFGSVVQDGAERLVAIVRPDVYTGSPAHEELVQLVAKSVVFHMGVEFATQETTMNIAAHLQRTRNAEATGDTYLYESFDPLFRR